MKKKKGFTLIELLVVIAIIGILAGIVLVSLSGAQKRAKDGRITSEMGQIRSSAEIFYGNTGNAYTGLCTATDTAAIKTDVNVQNPSAEFYCTSTASAYCAMAKLNGPGWFCVDSTLKSLATSGVPTCTTTGITCGL